MFGRLHYLLPLALLASVALLSFWLEQASKPDATNGKNGLGEPDAIVENFHSTLNDKNGQPLYKLSGKKSRYYGKSSTTEIDYPILDHLSDADGAVRITSVTADVAPDGESVVFNGQANVIQTPPNGKQPITLQSSRIEAYPKIHLIKVPTTVNINGQGMQVTAGNLELNTETRVLKLSGRVKAHYKT